LSRIVTTQLLSPDKEPAMDAATSPAGLRATAPPPRAVSPVPAAYAALAVFVLFLGALVVAVVGSGALPGAADRYVPARVAENIAVLAADATLQLLLGSALIVMAVTLGRYLGTDELLGWLAMIAGVVGGAAFIAAGAIQQETVFYAVFVDSKQAGELATASGASDLTALNLAINVVAGGMRSVGSYAFGLAWIGWAVIGVRVGRLPRLLGAVGVVAGVGFALTNWIGPLAGPFAFFGSLLWLSGLAIVLFRRSRVG
jgi:hypothetical protein